MTSFLDEQKQENLSLFTDLYELTMCASYFDNGKTEPATFDLFVRRLPENRGYLLVRRARTGPPLLRERQVH